MRVLETLNETDLEKGELKHYVLMYTLDELCLKLYQKWDRMLYNLQIVFL